MGQREFADEASLIHRTWLTAPSGGRAALVFAPPRPDTTYDQVLTCRLPMGGRHRLESLWKRAGVKNPGGVGHDEGRDRRQREATALARLVGDPSAVEPLITAARHDQDWPVRRQAVETLRAIGDTSAVESLVSELENQEMRQETVWALRELGDIRAVEPLVRVALQDMNPSVRSSAVKGPSK